MKNTERQFKLDELKYNESEKAKEDLSGLMDYCTNCLQQEAGSCKVTHEERVANSLCAKAYNKLHYGKRK